MPGHPRLPSRRRPLIAHRARPTSRANAVLLSVVLALGTPPAEPQAEEAPAPSPSTWSVAPASADGPDGRARFEYVVEPGHRYDDHVAIRNVGTETVELEVYAADAASDESGAFTVLAGDEASQGVGAWLDLPPRTIEVAARDAVLVPFGMTVPEDVEPGDYAGGVVAVMHTRGTGDASGVDVQTRVGTRVYVRVAGPVEPGLTVDTVSASYAHSINPARPGRATVAYTVVNTGNVRLDAAPVVQVTAPFGIWSGSADGAEVVDLFPGMAVSGTVELPVLPLGPMAAEVVVEPTSSAGQEVTVAEARGGTTLWAVPWAALVALLLLLLVLGAAVQARRRVARLAAVGTAGPAGPAPETVGAEVGGSDAPTGATPGDAPPEPAPAAGAGDVASPARPS